MRGVRLAIKCPKCHSENPETKQFCADCGTQLPPPQGHPPVVTETLQAPVRELTTGSTFAGRYQVIEELGHGGMGRVYKVFDTDIKEKIALKLLRPEIALDRETIERFSNELKLARKISHRNVCRMFDLGKADGTTFITMEYVHGEDLKRLIRKMGQLGAGRAVSIAKQVSEGLMEAHHLSIVHRDLKPQNIMVDEDGNARIMDFGIARSLHGKGITGAGVMIGTPEYMSPEQVEGKDVDQRSDIYSLGIILYEMLTGRVPFEGDTPFTIGVKHKSEIPRDPREINAQIPQDLGRAVLKCLEKDKAKRYQVAVDLHTDLEKIEQGLPTTERVVSKRRPFTSRQITVQFSLKKLLVPSMAVIVVLVGALAIWQIMGKRSTPPIAIGKPSLAVLYFKNNTGDEKLDLWRTGLSDSIITDLSQSRFINVLSSNEVLSIHRTLGLLDAKAYALEDLKRIGAGGRIEHVLQGTLSRAGDLFRIDYSLQEVEKGMTVGSGRVEGKGEASIFAMVDELTTKIKSDLKLSAGQIAGDIDKTLGQITTSSPEAYKLYVEGSGLYGSGQYRKAIEYYEKAVTVDPGFATAYRSMGMAYMVRGYSVKYRESINKAFDLSDRVSDRERYRIQAEFYGLSDRTLDKSIDAFKQLIALYPNDRGGNNNLGTTYMRLEEWDQAIERFDYLVQNEAVDLAHGLLAECYVAKGMFDEARKVLNRYLDNYPESGFVRSCSANEYLVRGHFDLALAEARSHTAKGRIYRFQGDLAAAEKEYEEYQKLLDPEEPLGQIWWLDGMESLRMLEGRIEESQGLLEKAAESVRQAGEKFLECRFLCRSAFNHLLQGAPQKALALMDRVWALSSEWERDFWQMLALHVRGIAALKMKDRDGALKAANELKNLADRSMFKKEIRQYYHLLGLVEMEGKNLPQAIPFLEKAVRLSGQRMGIGSNVSGQYMEMHALYRDSLARAYFQAGDLEKARAEYEIITTLTMGQRDFGDIYAKSFYMLGKIVEQQGDKTKAIEHYRKFLDLWKNADPGIPEVEDARKRLAGLTGG
jgi:serine/threonine protein kinase/Flp pilus assembly protein TadD